MLLPVNRASTIAKLLKQTRSPAFTLAGRAKQPMAPDVPAPARLRTDDRSAG